MTPQTPKTNYDLQSVDTVKICDDSDWLIDAPGKEKRGLMRSLYEKKQIEVKSEEFGLYNFATWEANLHFLEDGRVGRWKMKPEANKMKKESLIMLNITGSGEQRFGRENEPFYLKPSFVFDINAYLE